MSSKLRADFSVHIVISDEGWIIERCAKEITKRLAYVTYGREPNEAADLQYYVTYSCFRERVSPVEMAFFTHIEASEAAAKKFLAVARSVDHRVVMATRYARTLASRGLESTIIEPGVDVGKFTPVVRIGVVGRTYHTGRKGETLVASVMDIPGIEWCFTGSGWPGDSRYIPDDEMPDFYNGLDYVLIPSLYEGGPLSAHEAIACGKPVISSDVGWMDRLPHIPFKNGDPDDLRRVLLELVADRAAQRITVLPYSWENWALRHHDLFHAVMARSTPDAESAVEPVIAAAGSGRTVDCGKGALAGKIVSLVMHGREPATLGGPSVRVPRTVALLRDRGVDARADFATDRGAAGADILHLFNVWPPAAALNLIGQSVRSGSPIVLSPIYMNLSEFASTRSQVSRVLRRFKKEKAIVTALEDLSEHAKKSEGAEPAPNFRSAVRTMAEAADFLVFVSEHERRLIASLGVPVVNSKVVRNAVDYRKFSETSGALFAERFGVEDYVLCVGRLESRKNQALLARAVAGTGLPIVFIGHDGDEQYADTVRAIAGPNALFIPRIEPEDDLLASAYAGARAFCLPSFAEGAPLAALEAAAAGVPLVLSNRSGEKEYFGSLATYVDPFDLLGLREAVIAAHARGYDDDHRAALKDLVKRQFAWDRHVDDLIEVYETVAARRPAPAAHMSCEITWTIDLTTSLHHTGTPAGIARVEQEALRGIFDIAGRRAQAAAWGSATNRFYNLSWADAYTGNFDEIIARQKASGRSGLGNRRATRSLTIERGSSYLVFGGAWIRNARYVAALAELKNGRGVRLCLLIHDIIQHRLRDSYGEEIAAVFERNLRTMVQIADVILVYSNATRTDILDYCAEENLPAPTIELVRLGDIRLAESLDQAQPDILAGDFAEAGVERAVRSGYVLYVSAIDLRKNHKVLFDVWRQLIGRHGAATPHLFLVGRLGWGGEEIAAALRGHTALAEKVHILTGINDEKLDYLYRHAKFTVYPSLMEGWGLPVAESLMYGKVCVASASSSIPEIAPELCDLIDPLDVPDWTRRIERYLFEPEVLDRRTEEISGRYPERRWEDYASDVLSALSARPSILRTVVLPAEYSIDFGTAGDDLFSRFSAGGWHTAEAAGRWGEAAESAVAFDLLGRSVFGWTIRLLLSTLASDARCSRQVDVAVNGTIVGRLSVDVVPTEFFIPVPLDLLDGAGSLRGVKVEIRTSNVFRACDIMKNNDQRVLSIFVRSLSVSRTSLEDAAIRAVKMPSSGSAALATLQDQSEPGRAHIFRRAERRIRKWRKSLQVKVTRPPRR